MYRLNVVRMCVICIMVCCAAHNFCAPLAQDTQKNEEQVQKEHEALLAHAKKGQFDAVVATYEALSKNNETEHDAMHVVVQKIGAHPLSLAAFYGHLDVVKALLERHLPVNAVDQQNNTALVWAAACDGQACKKLFNTRACYHADCVDWLLKSGASIDVITGYGNSVLDCAIFYKNSKSIKLVIDAYARADKMHATILPPLIWAVSKNLAHAVFYLLQDSLVSVSEVDSNGDTALHWAVKNHYNAVIQILADFQPLVESKNKQGETPLSIAMKEGNNELVLYLAQKAAEFDNEKKNNWSALSWAAFKGHADVVSCILLQDVDVDEQDLLGNTALHWAIMGNQEAVVRMLLARNASCVVVNKDRWNPFDLACSYGNPEIVRSLAQTGIVDVDEHGKYGLSPLALAARYGKNDTIATLLSHGVAIDAPDASGNTPLFWACRAGNLAAAQLLIDAGADINRKNNYGFTPLYWAVHGKYLKIARLLLDAGALLQEKSPYTQSAWYRLALSYARVTNRLKNKFMAQR